jgi:vacuolar-type H+-ATPase subunit F/Vma7
MITTQPQIDTSDDFEKDIISHIIENHNREKELLKPVFEFLGKHGIGEYHLGSSVSHDEFISIAYTAFIYKFKPNYHFYVHDLYGKQYIKSQLTFYIQGCNSVTIFRNELIDKDDIVESLAIPLALKDSQKVIVNYNIYDKIKETIDLYTEKSKPIIVEKPIYIQRTKKSNPKSNAKKMCYLMVDSSTKYVKIGNSINPHKRERTLQSEKPTIEILHIFNKNIETELHQKYSKKRIRGEWFNLTTNEVSRIIKKYDKILLK